MAEFERLFILNEELSIFKISYNNITLTYDKENKNFLKINVQNNLESKKNNEYFYNEIEKFIKYFKYMIKVVQISKYIDDIPISIKAICDFQDLIKYIKD